MKKQVLRVSDVIPGALAKLLSRYGLKLVVQPDGSEIRGSFWGDNEAGIIGSKVFARSDTPAHSVLHETCHVICMAGNRRVNLARDAGSDDLEECAVCYLQIVLADCVDGVGRDRVMTDMDSWGYSFRVGRTRDWFEDDAKDALGFLSQHGLLNESGLPTFRLRA